MTREQRHSRKQPLKGLNSSSGANRTGTIPEQKKPKTVYHHWFPAFLIFISGTADTDI